MTPSGNVDALLAESAWIRALALRLCRDAHDAEDATQETCLAAARRPPRQGGNVRAYLARILRNVLHRDARSGARRDRRERAAAATRDGTVADPAELVARAELHGALVAAVLRLPEVQREVVLLHYFEAIDLAGVAARTRRSPEAVRALLRRARGQLRADLERRGDRSWVVLGALGRHAEPAASSSLVLGGIIVKGKALAAAAALVGLGLCYLPFADTGRAAATRAVPPPAGSTAAALPAAGLVPPAPVRVAVPPRARAVTGSLLGADPRLPWSTPLTATASWQAADGPARHESAVDVGTDGRFRLTLAAGDAARTLRLRLRADDPWYAAVDTTFDLPDRAEVPCEVALTVTPDPVLVGRAVDRNGAVIAGARVRCWHAPAGVPSAESLGAAATGDDGRWRLALSAASEVLVGLLPPVGRTDLVPAAVAVAVRAVTDLGDVALPPASTISGTVRWLDGRPVADAELDWRVRVAVVLDEDALLGWQDGRIVRQRRSASTDATGSFRLPVAEGETGVILVQRAAGCLPAEFTTTRATAPQQVDIAVAGRPVTIRVLRDGEPAGRAGVEWRRERVAGNYGTDARGELRQLVLEGPLRLRAVSRDRDHASEWAVFEQGPPAEVVLQLLPLAGERVVVRPDGAALGALGFAWLPHAEAAVSRTATILPTDSAYVLRAPPGARRLRLLGVVGQPSQFLLPTEIDVALPPPGDIVVPVRLGGRVRLSVTDGRGEFLGGTYRLLRDGAKVAPTRRTHAGEVHPAAANLPPDREHETELYEPGSYELEVDLGPRGIVRRSVVVPAGGTAPLRIVVP